MPDEMGNEDLLREGECPKTGCIEPARHDGPCISQRFYPPPDPVAEAERALKDALDELYWAGEAAERAVIEGTQADFSRAADRATRAYREAEMAAHRYSAERALAVLRQSGVTSDCSPMHWIRCVHDRGERVCHKGLREALERARDATV